MSFKKSLEPENKSITSFEVHKTFTFTEADSGSGIYSIPLIKGTASNLNNFSTSTATSTTISGNTFYKTPSWHSINTIYYRDITQMRGYVDLLNGVPTSSVAAFEYQSSQPVPQLGLDGVLRSTTSRTYIKPFTRQLHDTATVISIPQQLFGEKIEQNSFRLTDDSTDSTIIIRDDGYGNLYDTAYSSSFSLREPDVNNSGSLIGNIFYNDGIVVITDTGSFYSSVATGNGSDGFQIRFNSTQTIYEREYTCVVDENEFVHTTNRTLKVGLSGSAGMSPFQANPDDKSSEDNYPYLLHGFATSSYDSSGYEIGTELIGEATHSAFAPYVTSIGLYNDEDELVAIGKLATPIKNEKELALTFVVRFDTN